MGRLKSRRSTGAILMSADAKAFSRIGWTKAATFAPTRAGRRLMVMRATDLEAILAVVVVAGSVYVWGKDVLVYRGLP